jgi:hypothetical protein
MATFDTTGIIKLFSNNKFRLIALTLVLVFLGLMTFFNVYYKTDDCKPLIEQNKMLMDQNTLVIKRNSELVEGYLKIETLLGKVTHDTVYVTTTTTLKAEPIRVVESHSMRDSVMYVSNPVERSIKIKPETKKTINVKSGNQQNVMNQIQQIINVCKK